VILGHAHASTTEQICTHVDETALREAITKLNRLLGGTGE
jgi:site-specific recombinase XerD